MILMKRFSKKYQNLSDEQLVALSAKGRDAAFRELYQRYASKMYHYFLRMLAYQRELAEDFTQDLFLKIIENPGAFDTKRKFSTWFYTLASNMVKNEYRRKGRQVHMVTLEGDLKAYSPDYLLKQLDEPVLKKYLALAIQSLDQHHRSCFLLRYDSQLTIPEISEILNCPTGTVKSRLHYALKKLSSKLGVLVK